MNQTVYEMAEAGERLPLGTRIKETSGGIPTGKTKELSERLLEVANKPSELFADERPFWCYGWRDLHASIILPDITESPS